jgi:hypothetical protein
LLAELDTGAPRFTDGQVIAIDGKTLRGSFDKASNKSAIHMISAWASANSISLGQLVVVIRRFKTGHASAPENRPPGGGYWVKESSSSDLRARGFGSVRAVCAGLLVSGGIAAA